MTEFDDSIIISGSGTKIDGWYHHHYHTKGLLKKKVKTPNVYTQEKYDNIHIKDTGFGFHEIINDGRLFGYIFMPGCNSLYECSTNPDRPTFCYAFTATTIDIMSDTSPWYEFRDADGKPYFDHKTTQERRYEIPDTTFHPYVNAERDTKPADASGVYVLKHNPALKISPAQGLAGGAGYKKKYKIQISQFKVAKTYQKQKNTKQASAC